jgi:carboxypeptidase Taq
VLAGLKGSSLGMNAILQQAAGRALDPSAFQAHLRRRYLGCD